MYVLLRFSYISQPEHRHVHM